MFKFQISAPLDLLQYVQLVPGPLVMKTDLPLLQFVVSNSTFTAKNNGTMAEVTFTFQRKIMYHLANTYLPTISLLVIVESTLFLDDSRLEIAVNLSLTTLLVVYTLFQSISLTIPKTAYLKFVDYWLIFCLLAPFFIFLIQNVWYLDHSRKKKLLKESNNGNGWTEKEDSGQLKEIVLKKKTIRIVVPVVTIIFTCAYFITAICIYI